MITTRRPTSTDPIPSPGSLGPADSPDLVPDPPVDDRPADPLEVPVELTSEGTDADVLDQVREVGFDDDHDHAG